jgi:hypothetical protein
MATYPVINKETGEQKEVIKMSVHDWDQWKKTIQIGKEIGLIHQLVLESGEVGEVYDKLVRKIQDGMMFFVKHQKHLDQK